MHKDIWEAMMGENLRCRKQMNNKHNAFNAAVHVTVLLWVQLCVGGTPRVNKFGGFARNRENHELYILYFLK